MADTLGPSALRLRAYKIYRTLRRALIYRLPFAKKQILWCRSACLGHTIFDLDGHDPFRTFLICQQKTRVDVLLSQVPGSRINTPRVHSRIVRPFMARPDLFSFIEQQERLPWFKNSRFDSVVMDAFSELTDQKFTHKKEGWSFCCHYSDLTHSPEFEAAFSCQGLIPVGELEHVYDLFFAWFRALYPTTPITFFHYPATLDSRPVYKERAAEILRVITARAQHDPYLTSVSVPDSCVDFHEGDTFPYHYSHATNQEFLRVWNAHKKSAGSGMIRA